MKVRKRMIVLFLLPASILYLVFFLIPAVWAFYFSLFDWSGFAESRTFIGLGNFREILGDDLFWSSFKNTMRILFLGGVVTLGIAFIMTLLFSSKIRGKKFFRAVIFLPNVIATIALTTLWAFIYNPKFGLLTNFFKLLGFEDLSKILWTSQERIFYAMLVAMIWIEVGFMAILLLAGADKIPFDFYDAAKIEGANALQMFIHLTIPLMWDVITIAFVFWSIWALKVFEFPYAFYGIDTPTEIYTVGIYLYIVGFGKRAPIYRLGYATAIGVVLLLFVIVVVVALRRMMRREVYQY